MTYLPAPGACSFPVDPAIPAELQPDMIELQRALDCACRKLAEPMIELVRTANAARISAASDPPAAALTKIKAAAKKFRAIAEQR